MFFGSNKGTEGILSRRTLLQGAAASAILAPLPAQAEYQCAPRPMGGAQCFAQVHMSALSALQGNTNQIQSQWCWAACISMIFRYHKHPVSQARIVQETFGALVNMPAGSGLVISQQVNRQWVDDNRQPFRAELIAAFDFDSRVMAIDNTFITNALANDQPLIIGARSHAMVLTRVDYLAGGPQPIVIGGGVIDPWPGRGFRGLAPDEIVAVPMGGSLRYLAAIRVT